MASPYTPYSTLARTPGDSTAFLPMVADDASDVGVEGTVAEKGSASVERFALRERR